MKRNIVITVITFIIVLVVGILYLRVNVLGNMSEKIVEPKATSANVISFKASKGDRLKFSLRTTVNSGYVDFILTNSEGNVVKEFDRAKALETFVDIEYDDFYTLTAKYTDFTGKFSAKVSIKRF